MSCICSKVLRNNAIENSIIYTTAKHAITTDQRCICCFIDSPQQLAPDTAQTQTLSQASHKFTHPSISGTKFFNLLMALRYMSIGSFTLPAASTSDRSTLFRGGPIPTSTVLIGIPSRSTLASLDCPLLLLFLLGGPSGKTMPLMMLYTSSCVAIPKSPTSDLCSYRLQAPESNQSGLGTDQHMCCSYDYKLLHPVRPYRLQSYLIYESHPANAYQVSSTGNLSL